MRRSGRTTRIALHAVQELIANGEVITTDHVAYELKDQCTREMLKHFIENVYSIFWATFKSTIDHSIKTEIVRVNQVPMVHFKLIKKEQL
jgi:hypothetical protein